MNKKKLRLMYGVIFGIVLIGIFSSFVFAGSFNPEDNRTIGYEFLDEGIYTPSTETHCINGVCNKIIYSGTRFVNEDNQWKKIEDAKSLKNSSIRCVVDSDGENLAECLDWNYTSITLDLSQKSVSLTEELIPIKVYESTINEKNMDEKNMDELIMKSEVIESFSLLSKSKEKTINNLTIGDIIHFGESSTSIILQDANTENLKDSYVYSGSPDSNYGGSYLRFYHSEHRNYFSFNISSLPSSSLVSDANLYLYHYSSFVKGTHKIYNIYDGWKSSSDGTELAENQITWNNQPCGTGFDNSTFCNLGYESSTTFSSAQRWYSWQIKDSVIYAKTNNVNLSLVTKFIGASASGSQFASKEYGTTSLRPYVNITYTIDENPPTYSNANHNTTTNGTLANFSITYEDDFALEPNGQWIFATNNTGEWTNEAVTNFTSTPQAISTIKTLNSTVGTTIAYRWYANDSSGKINNTEIFYLTTTIAEDTTPPTYSNNQTNTTLAGANILHSLKWEDTEGLSGYIFQFCNGTWNGAKCISTEESEFNKCKNITVTSVGDLTDFPVYINLTKDADMQEDYEDLRFYSASCDAGGSLLNYEIENYTSTKADIWVKTTLETGENIISVHYGNAEASSGENVTGVWDSNHLMVQHLSESSGTLYDSTSNGVNYTTSGPTYSSSGLTGNSLEFDGSNDYAKTTNVFVSNPSELTIYSWFKKGSTGSTYEAALHQAESATIGSSSYWLGVDTSDYLTATIGANTGVGWSAGKTTTTYVEGDWYHLAASWDGSVVKVYINGVYNMQYDLNSYDSLTTPTRFGASSDGANYQFGGSIDEMRLSNIARSADWINQSYQVVQNQDTYVVEGSEEISYVSGWVKDNWVSMTGTINWSNVTKKINSTIGIDYAWCVYANDTSNNWNNSCVNPFVYVSTSAAEDTTPPTHSNNQTNTTIAGASVLFSILYNDDVALNPNGEYVFSTNNTGTWTNESVVNFTATPNWANVTKTLNSTVGTAVGYRWYADDNAGNNNNTPIYTLTVTSADTCTYTSGNWAVDCSDNCVISSPVDLSGNDISIIGTGTFTMTSDISNYGLAIIEGTDTNNKCIVICNGGCLKN